MLRGEITSCSNASIKSINALKMRKNRDQKNLYLFEGTKLFKESLTWNIPLVSVFYSKKWVEQNQLMEELKNADFDAYSVSDAVMHKLSTQKHPEGIICCAKKQKKDFQQCLTYVILEDVQDPGNVGTIIRSADAAGFDCIITTEKTADIYNDKVIRSSMGSVFHIPVVSVNDLNQTILDLKTNGVWIIGTALDGNDSLSFSMENHAKVGVVLGNESKGMQPTTKQICDELIRLQIWGHAESLNVSVAAGIIMYDLARKIH